MSFWIDDFQVLRGMGRGAVQVSVQAKGIEMWSMKLFILNRV